LEQTFATNACSLANRRIICSRARGRVCAKKHASQRAVCAHTPRWKRINNINNNNNDVLFIVVVVVVVGADVAGEATAHAVGAANATAAKPQSSPHNGSTAIARRAAAIRATLVRSGANQRAHAPRHGLATNSAVCHWR
jgi:hypothetical protein